MINFVLVWRKSILFPRRYSRKNDVYIFVPRSHSTVSRQWLLDLKFSPHQSGKPLITLAMFPLHYKFIRLAYFENIGGTGVGTDGQTSNGRAQNLMRPPIWSGPRPRLSRDLAQNTHRSVTSHHTSRHSFSERGDKYVHSVYVDIKAIFVKITDYKTVSRWLVILVCIIRRVKQDRLFKAGVQNVSRTTSLNLEMELIVQPVRLVDIVGKICRLWSILEVSIASSMHKINQRK